MKVAYFDDGSPEAGKVQQWMDEAGHDCVFTGNPDELAERLRQGRFDVAVINWDFQGMDHFRVLEQARQHGRDVPVIVASESATRHQIAEALQQEHCEFISRPLDRDEFMARLDTIWDHVGLRDATPEYGSELGPWRVDPERHEIRLNNKAVKLTEKDFELACFFFRNVGKLLTRRELLRAVWGISTPIESRTVDVHISRIRRALEMDGRHGYHIKTVYQRGYRLEPVEQEEEASAS